MSQLGPMYVLEAYCAKRILALIEQLQATVEEVLQRGLVEAPNSDDLETMILDALIVNTGLAAEEEELF